MSEEINDWPVPPAWLTPQPLRSTKEGYILEGDPEPITSSFADVINAFHRPRLPRKIYEVRNALALTLRYAHHPDFIGQGPWVPAAERYRPFRSTIAPLLAHPLWQSTVVIAAPFLLHLKRPRVAGSLDVILQLADKSLAVVTVVCQRQEERYQAVVRAELGGFIAAISDQRVILPSHAISVWAAPGETTIEYHHPDVCLGLWVDAADVARSLAKIQTPGRE